jgi:hypothetical protein
MWRGAIKRSRAIDESAVTDLHPGKVVVWPSTIHAWIDRPNGVCSWHFCPTGHRLAREGNDWVLYVAKDGEQVRGWISTLEEDYPVYFEMMNYYTSNHPSSFFTHNILTSAVTQDGRVNIMNQGVQIISNGAARGAHLTDRKAVRSLVTEHFGFDLPELETMRGCRAWVAISQSSGTVSYLRTSGGP